MSFKLIRFGESLITQVTMIVDLLFNLQNGSPQFSSSGSGPYNGCADNIAAYATKGPDMNATGGGGYGDGIALMLLAEVKDVAKCFLLLAEDW